MNIKYLNFPFEKKLKDDGSIFIEGYSNYNVPDRGNERVDPKGARFENYKKNPIILFDHGKDPAFGSMPVGKAVSIEAKEDGIYTKAFISNSKTEKISAIRDLVEEGILKTFSIGFDPANDEKDEKGIRVITDFELIEQSIVPIPMNQDSTFSVMLKRFEKNNNTFGKAYCLEKKLLSLGAVDAAGLVSLCFKKGQNLEDLLPNAARISKTPIGIIRACIDGEIRPMPSNVKNAILKLIFKDKKMAEDQEQEKEEAKKPIQQPEKMKPSQDEEMQEEQKADPMKPMMMLVSVEVPKSVFDSAELAANFVENHGYKPGMMVESDSSFVFQQIDGEGLNLDDASKVELGDGITGLLIPSQGAKACGKKPKEKAAEAPTIAIPSGADAVKPDDNPQLMAAKQTNILLGALIQEMQKLSQKFDEMIKVEMSDSEEEEEMMPNDEGEITKSLELLTKYRNNINQALKRMNI